jgi:hypothetical protein
MAELATLPPDQRAALQLLLTQGQSYAELAKLLSIDAEAVRRRAHAALEALGPEAGRRLTEERRAEVCDYLLGQQGRSQREATRAHLSESAAARAWAREVAGALRELAPDAVPDVPGDGAVAASAPTPAPGQEDELAPALAEEPSAPRVRERIPRPRGSIPTPPRPSSRLGGALLLAGAAIVIVVVIVLVVNGGGGGGKSSTLSTKPTTTSTNPASQPVAQINLFAPSGKTNVVGLAQVFRMGSRRAIVIAAQGLSPGTYALWLYNSRSDARLLGFVPQKVGSNGRFATQGQLPSDAAHFRRMVVTRETITKQTKKPPSQPGSIALQGDLKLG